MAEIKCVWKDRENWGKRKFYLFWILCSLAASVMVLWLSYLSYARYRDEMVRMEQKQLLTLAETVGKTLVSDIVQELDSMDLYFSLVESEDYGREKGLENTVLSVLERNKGLYLSAACMDRDGRFLFQRGPADFSGIKLQEGKDAQIVGKYFHEEGWYELFFSRGFWWKGEAYTAVYGIDLSALYEKIVKPVKVGEGGYSVVKDRDLSILMHHASGQIGMEAIYDRVREYPQLDLTDLIEWIQLQERQPEGWAVIHSYRWEDPALEPERRIVAYTTISLPGAEWIVNTTMPYGELNGPLNRMIFFCAGMAVLLESVLLFFLYSLTKSVLRSESQKKEIAYLKEINEGMELLRRKDEEIQHYQRVQSIGQMSSHIAHEFNNYLTPVLLYAGIMEEDESIGPENQKMARGILDSAGQAAELSRRLLDFSRNDSMGALTVIELTEEVGKVADMIQRLVPESVEFRLELAGEPLYTRGRNGMVRHILMNLEKNAVQAMEGKTGVLRISLERAKNPPAGQEEGQSWVLLTVADTGCGIGKDGMDKIFEPFYTTKRSGKGTGLGLSVIRNIMTSVGGHIEVDSRVGEGTAFFLYFPEADQEKKSEEREKNRRVLVVDDEKEIRKALEKKLRAGHFQVETYAHPAAALSRLEKQKDCCDVILTDYGIPAMNGLEFAQIVRKLYPEIRLVLMSGMEDGRFEWYVKNGFIDQFVPKRELADRLTEALIG